MSRPLTKFEKIRLAKEKIKQRAAEKEKRTCLPHLFSKFYTWQWKMINTRKQMSLTTAANQIGKTVGMIVRLIKHATEPEMWPKLWPEAIENGKKPTQFWYFHTDHTSLKREFDEKWIKEWLPRGKYRHEGKYRWTHYEKNNEIKWLKFPETGVTIYFFTYEMKAKNIQASTVYEIFADEEMRFDFYDECQARLRNTDGYFVSAFTATKGYDQWRLAMERQGETDEKFPHAFKQQISLYDCTHYSDGTPTRWADKAKIQKEIDKCSSKAEVLRRIHGRFVMASGLMVTEYNDRHYVDSRPIPKGWEVFAGIDPGSGGHAHPAGIVFVTVDPDYTEARVIKCWRGDGINTTNGQTLAKYIEMAKGLNMNTTVYDKQCRDIFLLAENVGITLEPANKSREDGFGLLNTLFKHNILEIERDDDPTHDGGEPYSKRLITELSSYTHEHTKKKASTPDNLIDPLRYLCMSIPFDLEELIKANPKKKKSDDPFGHIIDDRERRIAKQEKGIWDDEPDYSCDLDDETAEDINDYNDLIDEWS